VASKTFDIIFTSYKTSWFLRQTVATWFECFCFAPHGWSSSWRFFWPNSWPWGRCVRTVAYRLGLLPLSLSVLLRGPHREQKVYTSRPYLLVYFIQQAFLLHCPETSSSVIICFLSCACDCQFLPYLLRPCSLLVSYLHTVSCLCLMLLISYSIWLTCDFKKLCVLLGEYNLMHTQWHVNGRMGLIFYSYVALITNEVVVFLHLLSLICDDIIGMSLNGN
jgi:hypothetical protein